jgi:AraC-like DNA-binding protein/quercetin dioxygenase-like cupin family protein
MLTAPQTVCHGAPRFVPLLEAKTHAFMVTQYREPAYHYIWHYHPEVELVWNRQGCGWRFVGQSVEHFKPGDLVLLAGNVPHTWASVPDRKEEAIWTVIHFLPERWGPPFWQLPELQGLSRLLAKSIHGLRFAGRGRWEIGRAMEELSTLPSHDLASLVKFLAICERLVRTPHASLNAAGLEKPNADPDPRLHRLLQWLNTQAANPISESQAAAEVNMSPPAFSRWFKTHVGCVFHRYRNEMRVAMVCAALSSGQGNITQAAFQCGFSNLANFNRRFREITGLTPREFRRQNRRLQQESIRTFIMRLGRHGAIRIAPGDDAANSRKSREPLGSGALASAPATRSE